MFTKVLFFSHSWSDVAIILFRFIAVRQNSKEYNSPALNPLHRSIYSLSTLG